MVAETLERQVRRRARQRCEYCLVPEFAYIVPFQIDHVIALKHGGSAEPGNLAFACYHCNLHKGSDIATVDPQTRRLVRLFHPRRDRWAAHFKWNGPRIVGKTPVGRATVRMMQMNAVDAVNVRAALIAEGEDFRNVL